MKQPLILLPGLLCDEVLWQHQVQTLGDICSPQVVPLYEGEHVSDMARLVLNKAPHRFALAALSMGGYVAMEIMRQAPERVMRLALCNTTARPDNESQIARRRSFITLAKTGKFKGVTPKLLPYLIHHERVDDALLCTAIMEMSERVGRDAFIRQQTAIMSRPDSRPSLKEVGCPTLILVGRQDTLTPPAHASEMASLIKTSRMVVIEDCGHLSPLERPQAATALLRLWLENHIV